MNSSTVAATVEWPSSTAPRVGTPLPTTTIAVMIADCRTANPQNTAVLASRYAVVDRPTACSRWKMARSPTRSRIVSAVPMKAAAGISRARICADSSGVPACGPGMRNPLLPGTVSDSAPRMNGNSARKMK